MKTFLKNISPFNNKNDMPDLLFTVKKLLSFWFCYITGLLIAEFIVILLHFALGKNMLVGDVFDNRIITLIMYYGYIIVIAVLLFYWKFIEKKPLSAMGITKEPGSYFSGILLAIFLVFLSVCTITLTGNMTYHGSFKSADYPVILLFLGGFVIQGAMEELLCRGFLLHALREKISLPQAVVVSSIMFILPHWSALFAEEAVYGIIGIVNLILISIIFSLLTIQYQSIWAACGLHSFWNFMLYNILGLNLSGKDERITAIFSIQSIGKNIWNGSVYGIEASILTTVVLGLAGMLLLAKQKKTEAGKGLG